MFLILGFCLAIVSLYSAKQSEFRIAISFQKELIFIALVCEQLTNGRSGLAPQRVFYLFNRV